MLQFLILVTSLPIHEDVNEKKEGTGFIKAPGVLNLCSS